MGVCVCMYAEFFSSFSVQLNSYALTYDRHLAGLIEVLFTMCGGVTALVFVCVHRGGGYKCVLLTQSFGHRPKGLAVTVEVTLCQYSCH